ncbi:MAG: YidC/Oxa1 family membrane protein insertase [Lachnospira sp.]|nr:YidC/Oxa1 family membrane protein insertase [Lachnospira sp.]
MIQCLNIFGGLIMILLTQSDAWLIGDIARLLGYILNSLFKVTEIFGIQNIGLSIIIFTFIVKILMLPLTIKQQKFSRLSMMMNPELQAIAAKYKGKSDQDSIYKMNQEQREVYAKYGTSPTGGCLQLIIQMPILLALFNVIRNIPAYVTSVKNHFTGIIRTGEEVGISSYMDEIGTYVAKAKETGVTTKLEAFAKIDPSKENQLIDAMSKFTDAQWNELKAFFSNTIENQDLASSLQSVYASNGDGFAQMSTILTENVDKIDSMNSFFGINLAVNPEILSTAIIIPILAGLAQWVSTKLAEVKRNNNKKTTTEEPNPMGAMNNIMPIITAIFALTMPAALGLYWIAGSIFQIISQLIINAYFDKQDMEEVMKKNLEKANKKREKRGLPPQKSTVSAKDIINNSKAVASKADIDRRQKEREAQIKNSTEFYNKNEEKPGSLASKAAMVKKYNEKHNK